MNGSAWTPYTIGENISLSDGEKLMFRAGKDGNAFFSSDYENYYNFKISGSVAAKGNITSLLDRDCNRQNVPRCAFNSLFKYCTGLTSAPSLPATILAEYCYESMFAGCTSLTEAPALPATKLADYCYSSMFMGCTGLNYVKALFTDEPSKETTCNWLSGVAPTGTFVKSKYATWDVRGDDGIPEGWNVVTE